MSSLTQYNKKRNFNKTPEPPGKVQSSSNGRMYLIQKHAASHLHYDLRLEINGTLKSWAVPKGPCLDPKVKRLAVAVEDHPLEYGSFEGIIPQKEYGGGTVMLWDIGEWECEESPTKAYQSGVIKFTLYGSKLTGLWQLIRLKNPKDWLLIKKEDSAAISLQKKDILKKDRSIVTNRTMLQISKESTKVWHSNKPVKSTIVDSDTKSKANNISSHDKLIKLGKKLKLPSRVKPQLAKLVQHPPQCNEWLHEIKFDGYRIITIINKSQPRLLTRNGLDWTSKFPIIEQALKKAQIADDIILDGEVVAIDHNEIISFQLLQNKLDNKNNDPSIQLIYYVFDLLYYDGNNITSLPLGQRKEILKKIIPKNNRILKYSEHIIGNGSEVFNQACKNNLEGIISKKINSPYTPARNGDWLKIKCIARQEFVVGGYTTGNGSRKNLGSLLIGYYNKKEFIYCGHVGTGFNNKTLEELNTLLKPLQIKSNPFSSKPPRSNLTIWIKPRIVIEVEFREFTQDNIVRHASFKGIRKDKKAIQIKREDTELSDKKSIHQSKRKITATQYTGSLTNPDKIFYPEADITKKMLANYYLAIEKWILPFIKLRPLSLLRCPNGWQHTSFFQKHYIKSMPDGIYPVTIKDKSKTSQYIYIKDISGIISLVQLGVLEIHPWGSQIKATENPDTLIFDLDPAPNVAWKTVVKAAFTLKKHLQDLNLQSFVRTTGGKGLHLAIPLKKKYSWSEVNNFAKSFSQAIAEKYPNDFVFTMNKSKRTNKIFIDYLRNSHGATAIGNYSTRARANAPVAIPLAWTELTKKLNPQKFTILTVPKRLEKLDHDPWVDFFKLKQSLPKFT